MNLILITHGEIIHLKTSLIQETMKNIGKDRIKSITSEIVFRLTEDIEGPICVFFNSI
jgi:hypothetical protein